MIDSSSRFRYASLGSGSRGNGLVLAAGAARLLVDCGFGWREFAARCQRLGLAPEQLNAILVTHEHGDHVRGVASVAKRLGVPVYCTHGTAKAAKFTADIELRMIRPGQWLPCHGVTVKAFAVPHDAREPVQFQFQFGDRRLGLLTDLGSITPHVIDQLRSLNALLLECNYDPAMLADGPYPPALRRRVAGAYGHLSNQQAAALLTTLAGDRPERVVITHMSEKNNRPALARAALAPVMGCAPEHIHIADQTQGLPWAEV